MSEKEIMSEEAMNELINGFEVVRSLTEYGRKNIKYHFQRLQKENQELKDRIKDLELIVGIKRKRSLISKFNKEYDEEDKKKNPNRTYTRIEPDAEEIYKRYYDLKKQLEEKNKPQIFIDTQDMEERYAEELYQDYLEEENKKFKNQQKEFIEYLEDEINKIKEQIRTYDIWHEVGVDINFLILKKQFFIEILSKYKEITKE